MEENTTSNEDEVTGSKHMTSDQKRIVFEYLLQNSKNMKVKKGYKKLAATKFSISSRTITRIWLLGKQNITNGIDFTNKSFGHAGRKRVEIDINMVKEVPFNTRTNICSLSCAIGVAKSTVHCRIQEGHLRPHTNSVKPLLTEENKKARLRFCLSMITRDINLNVSLFSSMLNCIHIDEKWFSMTKKKNQRYYLLPDESPPLRSCKSSTFIDKIMFLCAVARPRFDTFHNTMFKGKIGIFPFVTKEAAKRRSKNRLAGTLKTKPINPITKDVIRRMMIDKVVPAIESMWPGGSGGGIIFVQQDNAKPHISVNDPEFVEAAQKNGFDIRLRFQPPNSHDLNICVGFGRETQTLQHEQAHTTIDGLVAAVEKSFEELHHDKLNKIFLTLQLHMIETMKASESHNYKQPHFDDNQCPNGTIPLQLTCDEELITFVDNQLT